MTTSTQQRRLADAVAWCSGGPVVQFSIGDGSISLLGGDPDLLLAEDVVEPTAEAASPLWLQGKALARAMKALPDGQVGVAASSRSLELRGPGHRLEVAAFSGSLPTPPRPPEKAWRVLASGDCAALAAAVMAALPAALGDPSRPAQSGVRLDGGNVVATDGGRLHRLDAPDLGRAATLPSAAARLLAQLVATGVASTKKNAATPPVVRVALGGRSVVVESTSSQGRRVLAARLAPEPYFEWRRVADARSDGATVVTVGRAALLAAVRSCAAEVVDLEASEGRLALRYISTEDGLCTGRGDVEVEAVVVGRSASLRLSVGYVIDALSTSPAADVVLRIAASEPLRLSCLGLDAVVMFSR